MTGGETPSKPAEPQSMTALREAAVTGFALGQMSSSIAMHRLRLNSSSSCSMSPQSRSTGTPSYRISSTRRRSRESRESMGSADGDKEKRGGRRSSLREERRKNSLLRSDHSVLEQAAALAKRRISSTIMPALPDDNEFSNEEEMVIAFFDAVAEGDADLVDELIERKVPVNATDEDGNTALILAAEGEPQIVEALIKAGANVNHQNEEGLTALLRAIAYEDEDIIEQLLANGAKTDLLDKTGKSANDHATNEDVRKLLGLDPLNSARGRDATPKGGRRNSVSKGDASGRRASVANVTMDVAGLFEAIGSGDVDQVNMCLDAGTPIDSRDDDQNTPLIISAEGEPGILATLIERGADVDLQNSNGVTALIAAVKFEDPEIVGMLIEAGADLNSRDRKGRTAQDFAKQVDKCVQAEMLQLFGVKDESGQQKAGKNRRRRKSMVHVDNETREMLEAVTAGDLPKLKGYLTRGYQVNAQDDEGNTALMFAAEGEPMILKELLRHGADPNIKNRSGNTALVSAIRAEDLDCIRELLDCNASTEIENREGLTPIFIAKQIGNESVMAMLLGLSEGLVKNAKSAPALPQMEVMRRGSLPSTSSVDRRTRAFFESVSEGDALRVERILKMEFNIDCRDDAGCVPLHFAAEGEKVILGILLKNRAQVNIANQEGVTPLMLAILFGDLDCVQMLLAAGADCTAKDKRQRCVQEYAVASQSSIIQNVIREASGGRPLI